MKVRELEIILIIIAATILMVIGVLLITAKVSNGRKFNHNKTEYESTLSEETTSREAFNHRTSNVPRPDEKQPPKSKGKESGQFAWVVITLFVMSLATIVAISISFYLYRWRRILIDKKPLLMPEAWGAEFINLSTSVHSLGAHIGEELNTTSNNMMVLGKMVNNQIETYMTMSDAVEKKEAELERYKHGYDAQIFRKFLKRFISIDQFILELSDTEDGASDSLVMVGRLLEDALAECGLQRFEPLVGEDFRTAEGVADHPEKENTTDPHLDFQISKVLACGYRLEISDDQFDTVKPAKVAIWVNEN